MCPSIKWISVLGIVMAGAATSTNAQDFYGNTASARSMGTGGVYIPSQRGALDALAMNPAGLTVLTGSTIDLSVTSVFAHGSYSNSANTDARLRDPAGLIPYAAFGTPLGHSRFSVGVGSMPELLSVSRWNYVDAPGVGGASYGLQKEKSAIVAVRSAAGVSFALSPAISVGASLGVVYNSNRLEGPYTFQAHPALAGLKTLLNLHTTGVGWNTSVGVIARPSKRVTVDASWKSRTVIDSEGKASGSLSQQFAALGLGAPPDFRYSAAVHNVLPQSVLAGLNWRMDKGWMLGFQGDWVNWRGAFTALPVSLSNGSNSAINGLLQSSALADTIPVLWKDQFAIRAGFEKTVAEDFVVRGGFAHSNNPVPASTLSPLTAAIAHSQLSTGAGYEHGHWHFDAGFAWYPTASEHVGKSSLLSGEFGDSTVRIGMVSLSLSSSFRF